MNSGSRGLIVSILLFVLWGTLVTGPFRYLAYAFRSVFLMLCRFAHLPQVLSAFLVTLALAIVAVIFLLLSSKKSAEYMAGIGAILSVLYYLYTCIISRSFNSLSFPVALGLAAALLFMMIRSEGGSLWLGDAYFYSIPVLLFYELVLTPLFSALKISGTLLSPFITVSGTGLSTRIGNLAGVPVLIWGVFLFTLTLLPVIFFSKGRAKG